MGGFSAVRDFNKVRKKAIQGVKGKSADLPSLKSADLFHNGTDVLSDVTAWHVIMRNSSRRVDPITSQILDLVDGKMLRAEPHERVSADGLSDEFGEILQRCKERKPDPIPESIMSALLEINEEAPVRAEESSVMQQQQQVDALDTSSDRKTRKTRALNIPLKRTARRSEYLKSALSIDTKTEKTAEENILPKRNKSIKFDDRPPGTIRQMSAGEFQRLGEHRSHYDPRHEPTRLELITQHSFEKPHESQDVYEAREAMRRRRKRSLRNPLGKRKDEVLSRYLKNRDIVSDQPSYKEMCSLGI